MRQDSGIPTTPIFILASPPFICWEHSVSVSIINPSQTLILHSLFLWLANRPYTRIHASQTDTQCQATSSVCRGKWQSAESRCVVKTAGFNDSNFLLGAQWANLKPCRGNSRSTFAFPHLNGWCTGTVQSVTAALCVLQWDPGLQQEGEWEKCFQFWRWTPGGGFAQAGHLGSDSNCWLYIKWWFWQATHENHWIQVYFIIPLMMSKISAAHQAKWAVNITCFYCVVWLTGDLYLHLHCHQGWNRNAAEAL